MSMIRRSDIKNPNAREAFVEFVNSIIDREIKPGYIPENPSEAWYIACVMVRQAMDKCGASGPEADDFINTVGILNDRVYGRAFESQPTAQF